MRSINTSIVALLPIGAILYVGVATLGSGALKDLALALFVGMAAGAYSSIFIATPLVVQLKSGEKAVTDAERRERAREKRTVDRYAEVPVFTEDMPVEAEPEDRSRARRPHGAPRAGRDRRPAAGGDRLRPGRADREGTRHRVTLLGPQPAQPAAALQATQEVTRRGRGPPLDALIRDVPDFPKPGVLFKDITPLLADPAAFRAVVVDLARAGRDDSGAVAVDKVVGHGGPRLHPRRLRWRWTSSAGSCRSASPASCPRETRSVSYDLEYGSETLEMHTDAIAPGDRVLVVDDVLATGGTAKATVELVEAAGGVVHGIVVLLELSFLPGRATVGDVPLTASAHRLTP